jgi:hypothetical protein
MFLFLLRCVVAATPQDEFDFASSNAKFSQMMQDVVRFHFLLLQYVFGFFKVWSIFSHANLLFAPYLF